MVLVLALDLGDDMSNILSRLASGLSGFGAGVADPSFAIKEAQRRREEEAALRKQQQDREVAQIQSGQTTPAFARPGGAEPFTPEQSVQARLAQLSQLDSPAAFEAINRLAPLAAQVKPASPAGKIQQDFNAGLIDQRTRDALIKKATSPRAPLVQITSGEKAKTRTSRDQLTEGLSAVNELITKIEEDPTRAGILGFGRGIAETTGGVVSDVASLIPGFEGVQQAVEGIQPKLGESIRGLRPLQNRLATGLARSRFGDSGRIPVQQLELARGDVNIADATSGRQTLDSLRQVRKELQDSLNALVGRSAEAGFDLPVKKPQKQNIIKLDANFNVIP